jgi:tetratricopeptide (TPR) repeat protein
MKKLFITLAILFSSIALWSQETDITAALNALQRGDYSSALNIYSKFLQSNEKYAPAFYGRAIANYKLKNYKAALEDANKAIDLDINYADAHFIAGLATIELNDYQNAIKFFTRAIELLPNNAKYIYSLANAYYFSQMDEDAIQQYTRAIELEPSFAPAYYGRGIAYYMANKFPQAKLDLEQYLAMDDRNVDLKFEAERILKVIERAK